MTNTNMRSLTRLPSSSSSSSRPPTSHIRTGWISGCVTHVFSSTCCPTQGGRTSDNRHSWPRGHSLCDQVRLAWAGPTPSWSPAYYTLSSPTRPDASGPGCSHPALASGMPSRPGVAVVARPTPLPGSGTLPPILFFSPAYAARCDLHALSLPPPGLWHTPAARTSPAGQPLCTLLTRNHGLPHCHLHTRAPTSLREKSCRGTYRLITKCSLLHTSSRIPSTPRNTRRSGHTTRR